MGAQCGSETDVDVTAESKVEKKEAIPANWGMVIWQKVKPDIVAKMLENKQNPNSTKCDSRHRTPAMLLAKHKKTEALKTLLDNANVSPVLPHKRALTLVMDRLI